MARHKHADVIHAFVEGAEIQFRSSAGERWEDERNPSFFASNEYRIKPRTVKREGWVNIGSIDRTVVMLDQPFLILKNLLC